MKPKSQSYGCLDGEVSQAMSSLTVKSRGEESIKGKIAGITPVTKEMYGVGAGGGNTTSLA